MGYVINKQGKKLEVNNPDGNCAENVVLVNDETILVDKYIINLFQKEMWNSNNKESEFIAEVILDNEPTDEQIIFHMVKNGINRYTGFAVVEKIKKLDFKEDYED